MTLCINTSGQDADSDPMELKNVKAMMRAVPAELETQKSKDICALAVEYVSRLDAIQRDATRQGSFTLAAAIQTEIDKIRGMGIESVTAITATPQSATPEPQLPHDRKPQSVPRKGVSGDLWVTLGGYSGSICININESRLIAFDAPGSPQTDNKTKRQYAKKSVTLKPGDTITARIQVARAGVRLGIPTSFAGILFSSADKRMWLSTTVNDWQEYVPSDIKNWWQITDKEHLETHPLVRAGHEEGNEVRRNTLRAANAGNADMELVWSWPPKTDFFVYREVKADDLIQTKESASEPDRRKGEAPTGMAKPPEDSGQTKIVEGEGWRGFRVGATREELITEFGKPENDPKSQWLQWRQKYHIHCLVDDTRGAFELRFDQGFKGETAGGVEIGSSEDKMRKTYGEPEHVTANGNGAKKFEFSKKGVLFWTFNGKVSQIVVFRAY